MQRLLPLIPSLPSFLAAPAQTPAPNQRPASPSPPSRPAPNSSSSTSSSPTPTRTHPQPQSHPTSPFSKTTSPSRSRTSKSTPLSQPPKPCRPMPSDAPRHLHQLHPHSSQQRRQHPPARHPQHPHEGSVLRPRPVEEIPQVREARHPHRHLRPHHPPHLLQGFTSDPELLKTVHQPEGPPRLPLCSTTPSAVAAGPESLSDTMSDIMGNDPTDIARSSPTSSSSRPSSNPSNCNSAPATPSTRMNQLARYLSGIPGRKNLIWFSGSFPINILPDGDLAEPLRRQSPTPKTSSARPPISSPPARSPSTPSTRAAS